MDLIMVCTVQISDISQSGPFPYHIFDSEPPPATLVELMFAGCYVWDTKAMHLNSSAHSPSHSQ